MADRFRPAPPPTARAGMGAPTAVFDAGLRSYMLAIYNYMTSGVLLSGVVALLVASNVAVRSVFFAASGAPDSSRLLLFLQRSVAAFPKDTPIVADMT